MFSPSEEALRTGKKILVPAGKSQPKIIRKDILCVSLQEMELSRNINPLLRQYVEDAVIPRYDSFDKGHQRDHAEYVIGEALKLSRYYDVNPDMVYAAAVFHDTGLCEDRKTHHIVSARIIREDEKLRYWFICFRKAKK